MVSKDTNTTIIDDSVMDDVFSGGSVDTNGADLLSAKDEDSTAKKEITQFSSVHGRQSHKLHLDKYYTPRDHADHVVKKTFELIGIDNITEVFESSAGAGVFLDATRDYLKAVGREDIPVYGYDLEPERDDIVQQDYLELFQYYKEGRLIIGNPPFGSRMQLAKKFFQKGVKEADYISWILPGGQYNNTNTLYEFDLTYSELLGDVEYSGKSVNSCFNIYERPATKVLNKRGVSQKLQDIQIFSEHDQGYRDMVDYDVRMVYWGSAGKILGPDDKDYAGEYKIKVYRPSIKDEVVQALLEAEDKWCEIVSFSAMPRLKQRDIIEYLKVKIPDIK